MQFIRIINAVDSHTMGEPTRIVTGGIPAIPGKTMLDKKMYLEENLDHFRSGIMLEPRGHNDMFGAIITSPISEEADLGVIFMDGGGYLNMCGHGTIGTMTVALETGIIPMVEPITKVVLEAPAGLVRGDVAVKNGRVQDVSFENVPSFLYKQDVEIEVPEIGKVTLDIAFGGSFFAIVSAKKLGIEVKPANIQKLNKFGMQIRDIVNDTIKIQHPELSDIDTVDLVEIYDDPTHSEANYKNVVIFGQGQVDRSPCGTGTSAKMATLYAKGMLKEGETFIYESILGTLFKGRIVGKVKVGDIDAIIPEITGSAYITGFNQLVFDSADPLNDGFILR